MNLSDDPNAPRHIEADDNDRSPLGELREWLRNQLPWWMISFTAHVVARSLSTADWPVRAAGHPGGRYPDVQCADRGGKQG